ncbi:MAG: purine-nucleoside phosphorylase [Clostridia bacterium]|nr:purine-nucleoside phosphorylase [Clostridia bacterium]
MEYRDYEIMLSAVREKTDFKPETAIILGSGLGALADETDTKAIVNYNEIPDFPVSTVQGHKGRFVFGYIYKVPVVIMQGRVHYYEGYSMEKATLPIRLMKMMGAEKLILTNAAGGINFDFKCGDLMLISDHISAFVPNPLIGRNIDEFGPRFPDMSDIYNKEIREKVKKIAKENNINLKEGVYAQLTGPSYESPAEIKMLRATGADAVGMSTVCEAIVANHCGFKVCGISCISNMASGVTENPLDHKEVQECADRIAPVFKKLIKEITKNI